MSALLPPLAWSRRWLLRGLSLALLTGGAGLVGLVILLSSSAGLTWLWSQLKETVGESLRGGELSIESLEGSLWSGLQLRGVRLISPEGERLMELQGLNLELYLPALASAELRVSQLQLRSPELSLRLDESGSGNWESLLPASGEESPPAEAETSEPWEGLPLRVTVQQLSVEGGALRWETPDASLGLEDLTLTVSGWAEGRRVLLEELALQAVDRSDEPTAVRLEGGMELQGSDLFLRPSQAVLGDSVLRLAGSVKDWDQAPELSLSLGMEPVHARDLQALAGELGLRGYLEGQLRLIGPLQDLTLDGSLSTPEGALQLAAQADLLDPHGAWSLSLQLDDWGPGALSAALEQPGRLEGELSGEGRGLSWPGMEGTLSLALESSELEGYPIDSVVMELAIQPEGTLEIEHSLLRSSGAELQLKGPLHEEGGDLELTLRVPDLGRLTDLGIEGAGGALQLQAAAWLDWSGPLTSVDGSGQLQAQDLSHSGGWIAEAGGDFQLSVLGESLEAEGSLSMTGLRHSEVTLQRLELPWRVKSDPESGGYLVEAEPSLGPLSSASERILESAQGSLTGRLPPEGDPELQLQLALGAVLSTAYDWPGGELALDLAEETADWQLSVLGREGPALDVSGRYELPSSKLSVWDLRWAPRGGSGWRLPKTAVLRQRGELLELEGWVLRSEQGEIHLSGSLLPDGALDLDAQLTEVDLQGLSEDLPWLPPGMGGLLSAELDLRGSTESPEVHASLHLRDLLLPGELDGLGAELELSLVGEELSAELELLERKQPVVFLNASLPWDEERGRPLLDRELRLHGWTAPLHLSRMQRMMPMLGELPEGQLALELIGSGSLEDPDWELKWGISTPLGKKILRMDGDLWWRQDLLSLESFSAVGGRPYFSINGQAETHWKGRAGSAVWGEGDPLPEALDDWISALQLSWTPHQLELEDLLEIAELELDAGGRLVGGITVSGSPSEPQLQAELGLEEGHLGGAAMEIESLELKPLSQSLHLQLSSQIGEGALQVNAHLPLELGKPFEEEQLRDGLLVKLDAEGLPLSILRAADPDVRDAQGLLDLRGEIQGSLADPQPRVDLSLREGSMLYRPLGMSYEEIDAQLRLRKGRVLVDHLTLETSPLASRPIGDQVGSFQLSGELRLQDLGLGELDLRLQARDAWLIHQPDMSLCVEGGLTLRGTYPELKLRGDITAREAKLILGESAWTGEQTFQLDPDLRILRGEQVSEASSEPEPSFWELWDIQLGLDLNQNAWLEVAMPMEDGYGKVSAALSRLGLDARLDGLLDWSMRGQEMELVGEVEMLRGEATVFGNDFVLDQGRIVFAGTDYTDPILDIAAAHSTGRYGDINAMISGPVSRMEMELSSSEGFSDMDVASILLIGLPTSELSKSQGGAGSEVLGAALGVMMGNAAADLGMSGLDMIALESSSETALSSVKAGQALSDKLFLIVGFNFDAEDGENLTEATVEWLISRKWFAQFVTGDEGESSADLYFRWRF